MEPFPDALIVPGGGQTPECTLSLMVQSRFDAALRRYHEVVAASGGAVRPVLIALSAGTPHKPNPRDAKGFDSKEATVGAAYVMSTEV